MQLMLAIVQSEDADLLTKRLNSAGFELTRLNTVGGFLASGNVTLLAAMEDNQVETVLDVIRKTCRTRRRFINPLPAGAEPAHLALAAPAYPLEVQVGGATVFCFPLKRLCVWARVPLRPAPNRRSPAQSDRGANIMNLVLSVVQNDDAEPVTRALLAAGHRVTRINTAGGFLRRGNVTLLVGVDEAQVDDVLRIIGANCRPQPQTASTETPTYAATAFVIGSITVCPRVTRALLIVDIFKTVARFRVCSPTRRPSCAVRWQQHTSLSLSQTLSKTTPALRSRRSLCGCQHPSTEPRHDRSPRRHRRRAGRMRPCCRCDELPSPGRAGRLADGLPGAGGVGRAGDRRRTCRTQRWWASRIA